jgi:hypothetical protein
MMTRGKQAGFDFGKRPAPPGSWLVGLAVGIAVTNLAACAMMLGTGAAIRDAAIGRPPVTSRRPPLR